MSDVSRFLPLSQRAPERDAPGRAAQLADVLRTAIATVPAGERGAFLAASGFTGVDTSDAGLAAFAGRVATARPPSLKTLGRAVRALLVAAPDAPLPPAVIGSVALSASTTAPFERRAAISGHTVRATDDGWSFGRGPELVGTARDIMTFLLGLTDSPPRRPVS